MHKTLIGALLSLTMLFVFSANLFAQTRGSELNKHPRIAEAIQALKEAKAELKAAPHTFGGHKAEAISSCDAAIKQLNYALAFKAKEDRHRASADLNISDYLQNVSFQNRRTELNDHPRIAAALQALESARTELNDAPHDFGGHKNAAIEAVDRAITQLKFALDFRAQEDRHR